MISQNIHTILIFAVGILLVIVASMNINISPPPQDINDIPNNYGKTYCLKVQTRANDDLEQKNVVNNGYILMLSSLICGLFLILLVFSDLIKLIVFYYNCYRNK